MSGSGSGSTGIGVGPPIPPKILLAKPGLVAGSPVAGKYGRGGGGGEDDSASLRSRHPSIGSLNLLSESWDFHIDRFLPFLTENTDFTVVGVIGPPGAGKSTIMNELYGFDATSPGMLPPLSVQSEDVRAMAKHCTAGIEPRVSSERLILLDTQPVFSSSVLAETMRLDGSSAINVLNGEPLPAELANEIMSIQLGVLLMSVCHLVLVVSEGVQDHSTWRLMSTVDLLKHGISDPSSLGPSPSLNSSSGLDKDGKDNVGEYMAAPIFVQTKLQGQDLTPDNSAKLKKAFTHYFSSSSFVSSTGIDDIDRPVTNLFAIPEKNKRDSSESQYESFDVRLWKLRDQVLSMKHPSFSKTVSEREWLKNSGKIWEQVKNSAVIAEYSKTLQNSGLFKR